jgi:hypothetical protein
MANIIIGPYWEGVSVDEMTRFHSEPGKVILRLSHCLITASNNEDTPNLRETSQGVLAVFGTPVYQGRTYDEWTDHQITRVAEHDYLSLDSSFALMWIRDGGRRFRLITDRFGSVGIFCFELDGTRFFSTEFQNAVRAHRVTGSSKINIPALVEYLWFRRLFGSKTYIQDIDWIAPSTVIDTDNRCATKKMEYWAPTTIQDTLTKDDWVDVLATNAIQAGRLAFLPKGRHGLMLSGGLDSRCLLGLGRNRYSTFCNSPKKNAETRIAEALAEAALAPHHYIERPHNYLDSIFDLAMSQSHGMTQYYECQFLGYAEMLSSEVDIVHLGLFWDIFFCGHYMPKRHRSFFGKPLIHFVPEKIDCLHIAQSFIDRVSYRQKTSNLAEFIDDKVYQQGRNSLLSSITNVVDKGREAGFEGVSLWEYIHLTNVGRHYSTLMAKSLRPYLTVMLPALTNANYDLAFNLPSKYKINWTAYQLMLNRIAPDLMLIENSNTHIKASTPLKIQSAMKVVKGVANLVKGGKPNVSINFAERSWPRARDAYGTGNVIDQQVNRLLSGGRVMDLGILNANMVRRAYSDTKNGVADHSILIGQLLTLEYGFLQSL